MPLILHIAGLDKYASPPVREKIMKAAARNSAITVYVYDGADHAFARINGQHYDKAAADLTIEHTEILRRIFAELTMAKAIRIHAHRWPGCSEMGRCRGRRRRSRLEIRIKQEAAGLNFVDTFTAAGFTSSIRCPPSSAWKVQVSSMPLDATSRNSRSATASPTHPARSAAHAGMRLMPSYRVVPVPDWCSGKLAASMMLQGMTVHYLIHDTVRLEKGHVVLLHAAAGGVGQIPHAMGEGERRDCYRFRWQRRQSGEGQGARCRSR